MVCPRCNAQIDNDAVFCGNCGNQVAPVAAQGETVIEATERLDTGSKQRGAVVNRDTSRPPLFPAPDARAFASPLPGSEWRNGQQMSLPPTVASPTPPIARARRFDSRRTAFLAIIVVAVIVAASAGAATLLRINTSTTNPRTVANVAAVSAKTTGAIAFSDSPNSQGLTDTVKMNISGLGAPSAGAQYNAWLVNEQNEQTLALGKLTAQGGNFVLDFTDPGKNLLGLGNKFFITQETGNANLPSSKPLLTAKFPDLAFVHIKHLLVAFPTTPHNIGLLVGLRDQARQLNAQATLLQGAANSGNINAIACAAQSTLNLIEGKNGPHARLLPGFCTRLNVAVANDGFGLLGAGGGEGYIATAAAHASLAATQPDSTDTIKLHAGHVIIATTNIKGWVTTIDQDAQALLANPGDTGKVPEMVTLADHTLNGVDLDNDEHVDPVPGEAGTITAYIHGQLMAQLTFAP